MAKFVSGERLRIAVERLRSSRASGGMVNFLILKRAIALAERGEIHLSTKDKPLQEAITELTLWPEKDDDGIRAPFLDVFGSINASNLGLKKHKYRSNGPADTLKNTSWSGVVEIAEGRHSKVARLRTHYIDQISGQVLLKDEKRSMPLAADAAVWYFRGQDVEPIVRRESDPATVERLLVREFANRLRLTDEEMTLIFEAEGSAHGR